MIYYCPNCEHFMTEDDLEEERFCYEDEYGLYDPYHAYHYGTKGVCPYCHNEDLEEYNERKIVEYTNDVVDNMDRMQREIKKLKEQIK